MARIRSVSLVRSSAASRMTVVPCAKHAATARTGNSSIALGTRLPAISVAWRSLDSTRMSATSSPPSKRRSSNVRRAPIDRRISSTPVRVGFTLTPWTTICACGWAAPATSQKAAELMSPGTRTSTAVRADGRTAMRSPSRSTSAPIACSIRSVWSLVAAGSRTTVCALRSKPCDEQAGLKLSAGDGHLVLDAVEAPAVEGQAALLEPPPRPMTCAPISCRGRTMRSMGRELQGLVAGDDAEEGLTGQQSGDQTHGGAAVAGIQDHRPARRGRPSLCRG